MKGLSTLTITQVNVIQCVLTEYCREQERRQREVKKKKKKKRRAKKKKLMSLTDRCQ